MGILIERPPVRENNPNYHEQRKIYVTKLRKVISNLIHKQGFLKAVVSKYDAGDHVKVMADTMVVVLTKIFDDIGGELDLTVAFQAGQLILVDLADDMKSVGRTVTQEEMGMIAQAAMVNFLKMNKGKYDMEKLRVYTEDLQRRHDSGQLQQEQNAFMGNV